MTEHPQPPVHQQLCDLLILAKSCEPWQVHGFHPCYHLLDESSSYNCSYMCLKTHLMNGEKQNLLVLQTPQAPLGEVFTLPHTFRSDSIRLLFGWNTSNFSNQSLIESDRTLRSVLLITWILIGFFHQDPIGIQVINSTITLNCSYYYF